MTEHTNTPAPRKRARKIVAGTAILVVGGGVAFAYWTTGGSGTGSATSSSDVVDVTIVQTGTAITTMAPGSGAHALSGTITNPNTGPVYIGTLTASISSVTVGGEVAVGCSADDYTLTDASEVLNKEALADDSSTWSGLSISFNNTGANQDACKGATVNLSYSLS